MNFIRILTLKEKKLNFNFLADFGFARFLADGHMAATLCGSPMYMVKIKLLFVSFLNTTKWYVTNFAGP